MFPLACHYNTTQADSLMTTVECMILAGGTQTKVTLVTTGTLFLVDSYIINYESLYVKQ